MAVKIITKRIVKERERPHCLGSGRQYRWEAYRESYPNVCGYGLTEQDAIDHLKYAVMPDWNGNLDGEGKPRGRGCLIGGNMFATSKVISHNKKQFEDE